MHYLVSIVIPNYNGIAHLNDCLNSLRKQIFQDFLTILVDNGSNDDSVDFVRRKYPECKVINLSENQGFAKAVNVGIRHVIENNLSEFILLLNNDVECDRHFIQELINGFKSPEIGSVACKMLNYFERTKIDDAGNFIKLKALPYPRGQGEKDTGQYDKEQFIFGACAGAAMYRSSVFETVSLFDEDFISYFEDVDFSFRLQHYGYKCFYNPKAVCYHKRGATILSNIANCRYLIEKNIIALRVKNYPLRILLKYFPVYLFSGYFRCIKDIYWYSLKVASYSLRGNIRGVMGLPKSLKKRRMIMSKSVVSAKYVTDLCEHLNF